VATSNKTTAVINANDSAIRFTPTLYSAVGKRFQKFLSQTGHIINNPIQGLNSLLKNSFWAHFDTKIGCK